MNDSSVRNAEVLIEKVAKAATDSIYDENAKKGEDVEEQS